MTLAEWCLLAVLCLPWVTIAIAKAQGAASFDNAGPRDEGFYRDPFRARALAAQQNGFEALPLFVAAVLLAELHHAPQPKVDALAIGTVAARLAYVAAYLASRPTLRSLAWFVGVGLAVAIFVSPLWGTGAGSR